eukprot:6179601-Pleurochrysis_carterae.AAC.1
MLGNDTVPEQQRWIDLLEESASGEPSMPCAQCRTICAEAFHARRGGGRERGRSGSNKASQKAGKRASEQSESTSCRKRSISTKPKLRFRRP